MDKRNEKKSECVSRKKELLPFTLFFPFNEIAIYTFQKNFNRIKDELNKQLSKQKVNSMDE